jgi:hypothetical protein
MFETYLEFSHLEYLAFVGGKEFIDFSSSEVD